MREAIYNFKLKHRKVWAWVISPLIWAVMAAAVVLIINFAKRLGG